MVFNDDATWDDLSKLATRSASTMINTLADGMLAYNKWISFGAGRTNAQIAIALSKTEGQVAEMGACFASLRELYGAANNEATYTGDRFYSLRKF